MSNLVVGCGTAFTAAISNALVGSVLLHSSPESNANWFDSKTNIFYGNSSNEGLVSSILDKQKVWYKYESAILNPKSWLFGSDVLLSRFKQSFTIHLVKILTISSNSLVTNFTESLTFWMAGESPPMPKTKLWYFSAVSKLAFYTLGSAQPLKF